MTLRNAFTFRLVRRNENLFDKRGWKTEKSWRTPIMHEKGGIHKLRKQNLYGPINNVLNVVNFPTKGDGRQRKSIKFCQFSLWKSPKDPYICTMQYDQMTYLNWNMEFTVGKIYEFNFYSTKISKFYVFREVGEVNPSNYKNLIDGKGPISLPRPWRSDRNAFASSTT